MACSARQLVGLHAGDAQEGEAVGRPAVALKHAGVVLAEHRCGVLVAMPAGDPGGP
jgi:hypothetical protein